MVLLKREIRCVVVLDLLDVMREVCPRLLCGKFGAMLSETVKLEVRLESEY